MRGQAHRLRWTACVVAATAWAAASADEFSQFGQDGAVPVLRPVRRTALFQKSLPPAAGTGVSAAPANTGPNAAVAPSLPNAVMPPPANSSVPPAPTLLNPPAQAAPFAATTISPDPGSLLAGGCPPAVSACLTSASGPCGACCGNDAAAMLPTFYLDVGPAFLTRSGIRDVAVAAHRTAAGVDFLTGRTLELDSFNAGARVTLGGQAGPGVLWEGSFLGGNTWRRQNGFSGGLLESSLSGLPVSADTARANGLTAFVLGTETVNYKSQFYSGDLNLKLAWTLCPRQYLLFGLRYLDLREKLQVSEVGGVAAPATVTGGDTTIDVRNAMVGPQVGYHLRLGSPWRRFAADFSVKGALVFDFAQVRDGTNLTASPVGPRAFRTADDKNEKAAVFDAQFGAAFRVNEKVAVRAGYQAIAVLGFASALSQPIPNALAADRSVHVNTGERAVYHGPYAAIEWTWGGTR